MITVAMEDPNIEVTSHVDGRFTIQINNDCELDVTEEEWSDIVYKINNCISFINENE